MAESNANTNTQATAAQEPTAANATQATAQTSSAQGNNEALFAELDKILDKRLGSIAKSALNANGIEGDEAKEILAAYRAQKNEKANTQEQRVNTLQQENEQLKAQIQKSRIDAAITQAATTLGIDAAKMPYVIKLADTSDVLDANGNPDTAKLTAALQKVLDDIPALKNDEGGKGFVTVGAASGTATQAQTANTQVPTKRWNRFN